MPMSSAQHNGNASANHGNASANHGGDGDRNGRLEPATVAQPLSEQDSISHKTDSRTNHHRYASPYRKDEEEYHEQRD